jgi:hypothetical protein
MLGLPAGRLLLGLVATNPSFLLELLHRQLCHAGAVRQSGAGRPAAHRVTAVRDA